MLKEIFYFLGIFGTISFAISGALTAIKNKMDPIGVAFIAFIVGNGGGTLRSILLGELPVFWIREQEYVWLSAGVGVGVYLFILLGKMLKIERAVSPNLKNLLDKYSLLADAVGLGVFCVSGTGKALASGAGFAIAAILGMLTAVGGGIIRDVICNEIPYIFRKEIYATAALLGAAGYLGLAPMLGMDMAAAISVVCVVAIRLAAVRWKISLPVA